MSGWIVKLFYCGIVWILSLPNKGSTSSVSDQMTDDEIYQVFGSNQVPTHRVVQIYWPKRTNENGEIVMTLDNNDGETKLHLKPTDGFLIAKHTPVWFAVSNQKQSENVKFELWPNAVANVGKFTTYHNVTDETAITIFHDDEHGSTVEGILKNMAIKSLPKRFRQPSSTVQGVIFEIRNNRRRKVSPVQNSIPSVSRSHVIAKRLQNFRAEEPNVNKIVRRGVEDNDNVPETVYLEMLIISDYDVHRELSLTDTEPLKYMIAYWNSVDLIYASLNNPKVRLNIAGIILAWDDTALDYITARSIDGEIRNVRRVVTNMPKIIAKKSPMSSSLKLFDVSILMTTRNLWGGVNGGGAYTNRYFGVAIYDAPCPDFVSVAKKSGDPGSAIIVWNMGFQRVDSAAHEVAHLLGVDHDDHPDDNSMYCNNVQDFIMGSSPSNSENSIKWSTCSIRRFQKYLRRNGTECLYNTPRWFSRTKALLGGELLTHNDQCSGIKNYIKACAKPVGKYARKNICHGISCTIYVENSNNGTTKCRASRTPALPGTLCDNDKHCFGGTCVSLSTP